MRGGQAGADDRVPQRRALGLEQRHLQTAPSILYDKHHRVRPAADFPFIDYGLIGVRAPHRRRRDPGRRQGRTWPSCCIALSRARRAGRDGGRRALLRDWLARGAGGLRAMAARTTLIVLDRDGVLNALLPNPDEPRPDSPMRPSEVTVFPWVPDVIRDLTRAGFGLVIASNQPAWAKGKTTRAELQAAHAVVLAAAAVGGRRHPELAHLLSPRRGQVRLPQTRDGPAGRGVCAAPGVRHRRVVDGGRPRARRHGGRHVRPQDRAARRRSAAEERASLPGETSSVRPSRGGTCVRSPILASTRGVSCARMVDLIEASGAGGRRHPWELARASFFQRVLRAQRRVR